MKITLTILYVVLFYGAFIGGMDMQELKKSCKEQRGVSYQVCMFMATQ